MPLPMMVTVSRPCDCGGTMIWRKRLFGHWRLECLCGRCGPWRLDPETGPALPLRKTDGAPSLPKK